MGNCNELDLLTLIVGVSVYIATIRLAVIGALASKVIGDDEKKKQSYKSFLLLLVPADLAIVVAGVLLFLKIFWADLFAGQCPGWFSQAIVWSMFVAVVVLAFHHAAASIKSLASFVIPRKKGE